MQLIDWVGVARNGLWILGLSIALAAFSYTVWLAPQRRTSLRRALNWGGFSVPFALGLLLFAAGLAWGATAAWERVAWIVLAVAFAWQAVAGWRVHTKSERKR